MASGTPTLIFSTQPPGTVQSGIQFTQYPAVQLTDGLGNNVAQAGVTITLTANGPAGGTFSYVIGTTDATGKATVTSASLTGTATNNLTIVATSPSYQSATSTTFNLIAGTPSPANFTASVPSSATQNTSVTITVQARDSANNACTSAANTVVVNVNGAQTTSASVTNNNNGTYTATYTATNIGTDTITITADGTAISGSPFTLTVSAPSSSLYPNKPAGLPTLYEWSCAGLWADTTGVKQTSGNGIISGTFWRFGSTAFASTDSTAPQSPNGVCDYQWLAGLTEGNSDGIWFEAWDTASLTDKSTYYESIRVKIQGSSFQMPNAGVMKMFGFWGCNGAGTANNQVYGAVNGSGTPTAVTLAVYTQNAVARQMSQNLDGTAYLTVGSWHQIEYLFRINSSDGSANGTCDVWIDGHHVISQSNVVWRTASFPRAFYLRKWDPTWGGNSGGTLANTITLELDHIYAAAA